MIKHSLVILVTGLLLGLVMPGYAGDSLLPEIPAAQARYSEAQGCVEPTADMRKNHMEYILHQRDETMPFYTIPIGGVPKYRGEVEFVPID